MNALVTAQLPSPNTKNACHYIRENNTTRDVTPESHKHASTSSRGLAKPIAPSRARSHPRRRWSSHEQNHLHMFWAIKSVAEIAADLNRTPVAVSRQALKVGLCNGAPQGWEFITNAAARTGFDFAGMCRVLHHSSVHIRSSVSLPDAKGRGRIVESHDVDAAVARWCAAETIATAARRLGFSEKAVRARVLAAVDRGEIARPRRRAHWRIPSATFDRLLAPMMTRETARAAASRIGVSPDSLKDWLVAAGIQKGDARQWSLSPDDVDRVVAERRARRCKAFRNTKTGETK